MMRISLGSVLFASFVSLAVFDAADGQATREDQTSAQPPVPSDVVGQTTVRQAMSSLRSLELAPGLFVLSGAANTGVLVVDGRALLIDCCDSVSAERLSSIGVQGVDIILCTQHRRTNVAGAYGFVGGGSSLVVPRRERQLFDKVEVYWDDPKNRWHIYQQQPGPEVLPRSIAVSHDVGDGDVIEWKGQTIRVVDTPGSTDGSVSYLVQAGGKTFAFCGDLLYGSGQLWDLYSLQKGFGQITDYHGFLGNRRTLVSSLRKLVAMNSDTWIPSHGDPVSEPKASAALLERRLDELWRNYTSISALNFYFPALLADTENDPTRMARAATFTPPSWVQRVRSTSYAIVSETGSAFVVDCGDESVIAMLKEWQAEKKIGAVEGCWITHYHDDHVDALDKLVAVFKCPVFTDRTIADIIEHPQRYFLPCISPCSVVVDRPTKDGASWDWHEFRLTAFHFPGQSLYHGGLFVQGKGTSVFFAGDSGAPTGLDDYTAGNRVFLGEGRGSQYCLDLWRRLQPDFIINEHQEEAFRFTADQLEYMKQTLYDRERIIAEMVPWNNPNFGIDEWWVRAYPYEQDCVPGATVTIDVQFTNHGSDPVLAAAEPVLPEGWEWDREASVEKVRISGRTNGWVGVDSPHSDVSARFRIKVPENVVPRHHIIPIRVLWNDQYVGPFRHAIVFVR